MKPRIPIPQHLLGGPFSHSDGLAAGLGHNRLAGTDLARPFYGVKVAGPPPLTLLERCRALQVRLPSRAFFSHATAARIYRAPLPLELEGETLLHVSQPQPMRAITAKGSRGHTVHIAAGDVRSHLGLRVSSPARTFCDLATTLSVADLVAVGDFLIHWRLPLTSPTEITDAAHAYKGRRGLRTLWAAIPYLNERSESRRESILRVILVDAGLTGFLANFWIETPAKRYRADLADPQLKVAIEYQSDYHADLKQFRADMTRKSRLRAAGWHVIAVNTDDLDDPAELSARIRSEIREWRQILAARTH